MAVEFVLGARSNSAGLVRMALFRVRNATEGDVNARAALLSEARMGVYWTLSGLWSCHLKPTGGDGRARGVARSKMHQHGCHLDLTIE